MFCIYKSKAPEHMEKDYSKYAAEDFLQDDYFLQSIKKPTPYTSSFWEEKLLQGKIIHEEYELAKQFLLTINVKKQELSDEELDYHYLKITRQKPWFSKRRFLHTAVAACFALILALSTLLVNNQIQKQSLAVVANSLKTADHPKQIELALCNGQKRFPIKSNNPEIKYLSDNRIAIDNSILQNTKISLNKKSYSQLYVPFGHRSRLTLSDGTKLWVNAGTLVVYPDVFADDKREVYVDGEVFMEVSHDTDRPFILNTKSFDISVLGTSFNVSAYEEKDLQSIVLVSGSLKVKSKNKLESVLQPQDMFTLQKGQSEITQVDVSSYILWKEGLYQFKKERLEVILQRLSFYYKKKISATNSAAALICSGKLDLKEDLERVLTGLSKTAPIQWSFIQGVYEISATNLNN